MKKLILAAVLAANLSVFAAEEKPFVAFVNVAGAIEPTLFANTVTNFLPTIMSVRSKLYTAPSVDVRTIMNPAVGDKSLGKGAALAVYFVNDPAFPPQLTAPCRWAIINVRNLNKDADKAKYEVRIRKMALKGLAFACGFGANQDAGRCVMGVGSFETLKGIDRTSASYSPFAAFPMSDFILERGLDPDVPVE